MPDTNEPPKGIGLTVPPLQSTCGLIAFANGVGFIRMVSSLAFPVQPLAVGVTVIIAVAGTLPLLLAVNAGMLLLVLLAAKPADSRLLVHANAAPLTLLVNNIVWVAVLLHTIWLLGVAVTVGIGLTVMVSVCTVPLHPFAVGVTEMIEVTGALPVLVPVNV